MLGRWFGVMAVGCAVAACTSNSTNDAGGNDGGGTDAITSGGDAAVTAPDGATGLDATVPIDVADASRNDATPTADGPVSTPDARADASDGSHPDAARGDGASLACAAIDLDTVGTRNGSSITYHFDNTSAPATGPFGAPSCTNSVGHELVFTHHVATASRLRVSTNFATTALDTVVWLLDGCTTSSTELGCTGDDNDNPRPSASTVVTDDPYAAGSTAYIVVSGDGTATGTGDLVVTELQEVAAGGVCDPTGDTTACSNNGVCVTESGMSRCEQSRYQLMEVTAPAWVDACATGTHVSLTPTVAGGTAMDARDNGHATAAIPLPFAFQFFGDAVEQIWPSTNGYAVFGNTAPTDTPGGDSEDGRGVLPFRDEGALVAPFWQNIALRASPGSDICYTTVGTGTSQQFVLEWLDAQPTGSDSAHVTFEVVLTQGTNAIDFVYHQLDPLGATENDGAEATIGMQSPMGVRTFPRQGDVTVETALHFVPSTAHEM